MLLSSNPASSNAIEAKGRLNSRPGLRPAVSQFRAKRLPVTSSIGTRAVHGRFGGRALFVDLLIGIVDPISLPIAFEDTAARGKHRIAGSRRGTALILFRLLCGFLLLLCCI